MKKNIKTLIATTLAVCIFSVPVFAQTVGKVMFEKGDKYTITYAIPDNSNSKFIEYVNSQISKSTNSSITEVKEAGKTLSELEDTSLSSEYISFYDIHKAGDLTSVVTTNYVYTGGAHGLTVLNSYTGFNNSTEAITVDKLFKDGIDGIKILKDKINAKIDENSSIYFEDAKNTVNAKNTFDYYIDGNNIVIYFSAYEIAPYSAGIPKFNISVDELKDALKPEIYTNIIKGTSLSDTRLNGESFELSEKIVKEENKTLIPLRAVCDALGLEIGWTAETGATVSGKKVENITLINGVSYIDSNADVFPDNVYVNYIPNEGLRLYK